MNKPSALLCIVQVFIAMYWTRKLNVCVRTKQNHLLTVLAEECGPKQIMDKLDFLRCSFNEKEAFGNFLLESREKCVCIEKSYELVGLQNKCLISNVNAYVNNFEGIERLGERLAQKELNNAMEVHKRRRYADFLTDKKNPRQKAQRYNPNYNLPLPKNNHHRKRRDDNRKIKEKENVHIPVPEPKVEIPKENASVQKHERQNKNEEKRGHQKEKLMPKKEKVQAVLFGKNKII